MFHNITILLYFWSNKCRLSYLIYPKHLNSSLISVSSFTNTLYSFAHFPDIEFMDSAVRVKSNKKLKLKWTRMNDATAPLCRQSGWLGVNVCETAYRPVDHAWGACLSEREAGGRVCGRFWIHGERESGGYGQAAEGSLSLSYQPTGLSLTSQDLWKTHTSTDVSTANARVHYRHNTNLSSTAGPQMHCKNALTPLEGASAQQ